MKNWEKQELRNKVKSYNKAGYSKKDAIKYLSDRFKKQTIINYWNALCVEGEQ